MKANANIAFLFLFFLFFSSCQTKKSKEDFERLAGIDSIVEVLPQVAINELNRMPKVNLSGFNEAYHTLIFISALERQSFDFNTDSDINDALTFFSKNKKSQQIYFYRSLMYQGIVRYRMGIVDSTAYTPLKQANNFFIKNEQSKSLNIYLCNFYLGKIHEKTNNLLPANTYLLEAAKVAKQLSDEKYLFDAYIELFFVEVKSKDYQKAQEYLSQLETLVEQYPEFSTAYKNAKSVYYEQTRQYTKAIEIDRQLLTQSIVDNVSDDIRTHSYKLSKSYDALNQLDSALFFANKSVEHIQNKDYHLNYFYFQNLADIALKKSEWETAAEAYKKAFDNMANSTSKNLDVKILELESKYDKSEAEKNALLYRNRSIVLIAALAVLLLLVVFGIIYWRIRREKTRMAQQLLEEEKKRLSAEIENAELELLKREFMIPIYQQISNRNTEIKNLLSDLKTNSVIVKHPNLLDRIEQAFADFTQASTSKTTYQISNENFLAITGLDSSVVEMLNTNEKALLVFLKMELDNQQIAVLFNTTASGIRGRRSLLRKKITDLALDISGIEV